MEDLSQDLRDLEAVTPEGEMADPTQRALATPGRDPQQLSATWDRIAPQQAAPTHGRCPPQVAPFPVRALQPVTYPPARPIPEAVMESDAVPGTSHSAPLRLVRGNPQRRPAVSNNSGGPNPKKKKEEDLSPKHAGAAQKVHEIMQELINVDTIIQNEEAEIRRRQLIIETLLSVMQAKCKELDALIENYDNGVIRSSRQYSNSASRSVQGGGALADNASSPRSAHSGEGLGGGEGGDGSSSTPLQVSDDSDRVEEEERDAGSPPPPLLHSGIVYIVYTLKNCIFVHCRISPEEDPILKRCYIIRRRR
ncbi:PREDICTED: uncharacterized protein LOC107126068 isoform X2 [Gekko japonicus]|uniref:Uncharacterized protein LOC107126068 isoform X2 n=1 Tax=Gekko japonicus TaxID=146911 RepID=A0ABM1LGG8_GEKJA|nr:PREDICTED: uncharacterized protein LOC107126068 isoform X2 [Gekko japonicus]